MNPRLLLLGIGIAVGYVLGTRAGREKYDRMKAAVVGAWEDPRVVKVRHDVEAYAREQGPVIRERAEHAAQVAAERTAAATKVAAERTAATAKTVADRTAATAKSVAEKAKDLLDRDGDGSEPAGDAPRAGSAL